MLPLLAILAFTPPVHTAHKSSEAQLPKRDACVLTVSVAWGMKKDSRDWGDKLFPAWLEVGKPLPDYGVEDETPASNVVLEGEVAGWGRRGRGPHVTFEDMPSSHYTHDLNFFVKPDKAYENLLGIQDIDPCPKERKSLAAALHMTSRFERIGFDASTLKKVADQLRAKLATAACTSSAGWKKQQVMEIEWESGVGASNSINPCARNNLRGESCGFYSAGHKRRERFWAWPSAGDRVHVEGVWVWDRGHPPAKTEIHPPRLVAVQRKLPDLHAHGGRNMVATRADVFASGDGSGYFSNRRQKVSARPVRMGEKDYSFTVTHLLPRPAGNPTLRWAVEKRPGDTFGAEPRIEPAPFNQPWVKVTIPWKSAGIGDRAVFGRTLRLFWDDAAARGVSSDFKARLFRVTIDKVKVNKTQESMRWDRAEMRIFADVGGHWMFLNEFVSGADVLSGGLGNAKKKTYPLVGASALVLAPAGGSIRIHAGGWESDGTNRTMGQIEEIVPKCDRRTSSRFGDLAKDYLYHGGVDDPIGEIEWWVNVDRVRRGQPMVMESYGLADPARDDVAPVTRSREDVFRIQFTVEELPWP